METQQALRIEEQIEQQSFRETRNWVGKRHLSEYDMHRMYKEGILQKDKRGYFTYERITDMFENEEIGAKFYLEDSYQHMERLMNAILDEAEELHEKFVERTDNVWQSRANIFRNMVNEYLFDLIKGLYFYGIGPEEGTNLLSPRQIDEWLEEQKDFGSFMDYLASNSGTGLGYIEAFRSVAKFSLR